VLGLWPLIVAALAVLVLLRPRAAA
jgi:hypothetical protein